MKRDVPPGVPSDRTGRRRFLGRMAGGSLMPWLLGSTGLLAQGASQEPVDQGASGLIPQENARPGALDWQLTRVRADREGFRSPWIEGYCSKQSVRAGETIEIMVSTRPARRFRIELFRM